MIAAQTWAATALAADRTVVEPARARPASLAALSRWRAIPGAVGHWHCERTVAVWWACRARAREGHGTWSMADGGWWHALASICVGIRSLGQRSSSLSGRYPFSLLLLPSPNITACASAVPSGQFVWASPSPCWRRCNGAYLPLIWR
jgi:hypothetical protein